MRERDSGEDDSDGPRVDSPQFDHPEVVGVRVPGVELHVVFTLIVDVLLEHFPPVQGRGSGVFPAQLLPSAAVLSDGVGALAEVV